MTQLHPGKLGSTISVAVRYPTPTEVRFQVVSWIASSVPVARSKARSATQALRPSGKPLGNLCPLPVLVTLRCSGWVVPASALVGPESVSVTTLRSRSQAKRAWCVAGPLPVVSQYALWYGLVSLADEKL